MSTRWSVGRSVGATLIVVEALSGGLGAVQRIMSRKKQGEDGVVACCGLWVRRIGRPGQDSGAKKNAGGTSLI